MSPENVQLKDLLKAALIDGADLEIAAGSLADASPDDLQTVLGEFVTDEGTAAVPLLERLALLGHRISVPAVHTLGSITDASAASALQQVGDSPVSVDVRKAARRELHRLASKGIRPEEGIAPLHSQAAPQDEPYMTLASPIDGAGNRGIWLAFRRGGDVAFISILISDVEGVKDAFARDSSVSRFDREARRVLGDEEFPWIEMPADYARHLLDVAHARNAASGTALPLEFLAWRGRIGRPRHPVEQPIIYSVLSAGEVRWDPRYLDDSGRLYELDLFRAWILDKDEVEEFVRERLSAERTGLVLAGVSGEDRERMIEDRAVQRIFDPRRRALLKGRLEEMAYVLWKLDRLEAAKRALAAALALEPPDRPLQDHPFVKEMVHWSLEIVTEMAKGERMRAVRPGLQIHLP